MDKANQSLMQLIKRVHGFVEKPDLGKHRQSQNTIGAILGNNKEVSYKEVDLNGIHGEWVSINKVHMKKYIILYCHGGGYSTGSCVYGRTLTSKLAISTSMDVLSFDYRLAPEYPYPAAVNDAMVVWDYLMLLGYGARDIIVCGDSAGGNLALVLTLKLKAAGRLLPRGLVLMSPWTDLTSSGKSHQMKADVDPILDKEYLDRMIAAYTGDYMAAVNSSENSKETEEDGLQNPYISPLFGDFTGFPPTYIQVGENEVLLSDALELQRKMRKNQVSVTLDHFKGMWHVFQMSPVKVAYEAMDKNAEFIFSICR